MNFASHATEQIMLWLDNDFRRVGQMGAMYHYSTEHWGTMNVAFTAFKKLREAYDDEDPLKS